MSLCPLNSCWDAPGPAMRPGLKHFALIAYLTAQLLPAFDLAGALMFGWMATFLSGLGSLMALEGSNFVHERGQTAACLAGALANISFVVALVAAYCGKTVRARVLGSCAVSAAVLSVLALSFGSKSFLPNVGCGLWLAAMVHLVIHGASGYEARNPRPPGAVLKKSGSP